MYKVKFSYKGAFLFEYGFAHRTLKTLLQLQEAGDCELIEISKLNFSWEVFLKCLTNKMDVC